MSAQGKYFSKDSLQIRGVFCLLELAGGGFFFCFLEAHSIRLFY